MKRTVAIQDAARPWAAFRRLADVDALIDHRTGIISTVQEVPRDSGAPDFFHFAAQACDTSAFCRQKNFATTGGASVSRDQALAKAVGEGVERYCAAIYEFEELPLASYADARFPCVHPSDFALFSEAQYAEPAFPWVPFTARTPVRWCTAKDLGSGEPRYVPAAMVYVPYAFYQGTGDSPITQPISTGLACHVTREKAILSGLCEVVERDAFTVMWQARLTLPQIRVETLSDSNYDRVQRFERTGASVVLVDITTDAMIPTVLAVLRSNHPLAPALVFAASASLNPEDAVGKALEELAHTLRYSQQIMKSLPRLVPEPEFGNVISQMHHLNYWCDPANRSSADFVFGSQQRIDFDEMVCYASGDEAADLARAVDLIQGSGHSVVCSDITTPDVADCGLTVVRVLVPGFHPLFMGHKIRALGGERLAKVPLRVGQSGVTAEGGDNPFPHPYP